MSCRLVAAALVFSLSAPLAADPLYSKNFHPLTALLGLPSMRSAQVLPPGQWSLGAYASVANHFSAGARSTEQQSFDGETSRIDSQWRLGLAGQFELQLELPWLRHSGGELDSFIEDWHELFGLSDGNRKQYPRGQLRFAYNGPESQFLFEDSNSGLGDVAVALSKTLFSAERFAVLGRLGYKFATGDEDKFLGSGADDVYLALNASAYSGALAWHGQLGYLHTGASELLGDAQRHGLWFAGAGVEWQAWPSLALQAQIDSHTALLDSDLRALGDTAMQLTLGVNWQFHRQWQLQASFFEDIRSNTAPDIVFLVGLKYLP